MILHNSEFQECKMVFFENESGRILIDKPAGITSFGVVARIRRVLKDEFGKKVKVGHTGTLDPFATGLLVLLYGKETKNAMSLTKFDKVYEAEFTLGQISSTGDPEGEISKCENFEIPKRTVEIFNFEILSYDFPKLKVRTHVSSGTYIRSLAEDLGKNLGCGAFCSQLRRTKIADFNISKAKKLEDFGILD